MSLTKNIMELEAAKRRVQDQMDALLEEGSLSGASEGIAKLLKEKGDLDILSLKQRSVYDNHISPLLQVVCADSECDEEISEEFVADAIRMGRDDALCHIHEYIQNQMEKDD
ncbi:hypothetical protein [Achromobacter xylosoxidans]|uniref:Uncharacterized protein n=1 Tax=Alcaligenes xylosoxydans xylosoxydans TaxID=85698 RepID=A0A0X8NXF5_ALCXX|nr:hypothetical protein [Achromobacter xylosoxidans]AMG36091.1 hypothetical protein AL504_08665 [Achromobacter xylosoxidans]